MAETYYLWRAVDHEGEVLEVFVTKRRDRKAALRFLRKAMRDGPKIIGQRYKWIGVPRVLRTLLAYSGDLWSRERVTI